MSHGWAYNISPEGFEYQIQFFINHRYKFISIDEYYKNSFCKNDHSQLEQLAYSYNSGS
jgi:hypothetical protein